ncbi:MAG: ATP-binding protein [Oscillospiraceae bacterium]|jgi:predicted AAA+ superfamily ATPase|nr:ATP-binding protein [Oscillospiraceae bacterium]
MPLIKRPQYTEKILQYADRPSVKILRGMKRSGKTAILQLLQEEFLARGVMKKNIVYMSFEGLENAAVTDYQSLYDAIAARVTPGERTYLFLDEAARVYGWEKAALHMLHDFDADIYVAGSNGAITTKNTLAVLEEHHELFDVYPLSFAEYIAFRETHAQAEDIQRELVRYLMFGGFPSLHLRAYTQLEAYTYARDVMSAAIWNEVAGSSQLRRADQLDRIIRFVFENVGNTFSAKFLSDKLKGENKEINIETVYTYLERLENAYIVSRCRRYDLHVGEALKTQEKFYILDTSLRYAMMGFSPDTVAAALENIVYLELRRRGYDVYMGKLGRREIDFVAQRGEDRIYVQLSSDLRGGEARDDYSLLMSAHDSYPKLILTTEPGASGNKNGVRTMNAADFLLRREIV